MNSPQSALNSPQSALNSPRVVDARARDVVARAAFALGCVFFAACSASHAMLRVGNQAVFTLTVDHANAYLLPAPDGKLLLIDSGFPKNVDALERLIRKVGFAPQNVRTLIVTHGHYDHAGAARHFQDWYGTQIIAGGGDQLMLAAGKHIDPLCPTDFVARRLRDESQNGTFPPVTPNTWIDHDTPLRPLAGIDGMIYSLPGHTKGSLVIVVGDAVFVGDLFRGSILGNDATRHFYMCDLAANRRDVLHLTNDLAPHATYYFPGHFGPVRAERVRKAFQ